ncbi:MAG TPA: choice-of-anchor Q domain-containing protein [Capillimicrobium sp.]
MTRRTIPILCGAALAAAALPSAASAAQFCVHKPATTCAAGATDVGDALQLALNQAKANGAGGDTITIGPGTFEGPWVADTSAAETVSIVGSGQATVLTTDLPGSWLVEGGTGDLRISDLAITLPDGAGVIGALRDVRRVERVTITGSDINGVRLPADGAVADSAITTLAGIAVSVPIGADDVTIDRSILQGDNAVATRAANTRVRRSQLTGGELGVFGNGASGARIEDTTVRMPSGDTAIQLQCDATRDGSGLIKHVSADGPVTSRCDGYPARTAHVEVDSSIFWSTHWGICADGAATIETNYSWITPQTCAPLPVGAWISYPGDQAGPSPLVGGGDLRALPGSVAIDRGRPAPAGPAFDVIGGLRSVDGNGDGVARPDIGAYELVPAPPVPAGGGGGGAAPEVPSTDPAPIADPGPEPIVPVEPVTPPAAVDVAALLRQMLASGERGAYTLAFPQAGKLRVVWRTAKGRVLARGAVRRAATGEAQLQVRLTRRGRRAARAGHRTRVSARATFTPAGGAPVAVRRSVRFAVAQRRAA